MFANMNAILSMRAAVPIEVLAYVAGIIDGEGCIHINRSTFPRQPHLSTRYTAMVTVGNTGRPLMNLLEATFGGRIDTRPATDRHKEFYVWNAAGPRAAHVLRLVRPYLRLKQAQCDLLLAFIDGFRSFRGGSYARGHAPRIGLEELARRERIWREIKALNRPGPVRSNTLSE
jgi:hypothetical protein